MLRALRLVYVNKGWNGDDISYIKSTDFGDWVVEKDGAEYDSEILTWVTRYQGIPLIKLKDLVGTALQYSAPPPNDKHN